MLRLLSKRAAPLGLITGCLLLGAGLLAAAAPGPKHADRGKLVVHEWGTFLSVQGSDGIPLGGMIESDEQLPPFVRDRDMNGLPGWKIFTKMETPVTYFYVDRPREVEVRVDMPTGVLTHWFPTVTSFGPPKQAKDKAAVAGSYLDWGKIQLLPPSPAPPPNFVGPPNPDHLPPVSKESIWRFARETDSAIVKIAKGRLVPEEGEREKFLFYRGLGTFALPLKVQTSGPGEDVRLSLENQGKAVLTGLFAVRVAQRGIQFAALGTLAGSTSELTSTATLLSPPLPLDRGVPQVKAQVAEALVGAGLYRQEAAAMVNTWEHSYFRTEGFRLLYVLPRRTVDRLIPIHVKPEPDQMVRVMIGRVELLTPAAEKRLETAVADLNSQDAAAQKAAEAELARLGRLREPALRRILAFSKQADIRSRAEKLIQAAVGKK